MRILPALLSLLLMPLPALASDAHCRFTEARQLPLQLAGAKTVVFEVNQHDLDLRAGGGTASLSGRACASSAELLRDLSVTQRRDGDTLTVHLQRDGRRAALGGQAYAWLDIHAGIPDDVRVQLKVGSGDARVEGARSLSIDLGAGDVDALHTRGSVHAAVGSGDLVVDGAGSLALLGLGSGEAKASAISGDVSVGSIGSGDFSLRDAGGSLRIDTVGSGDVDVRQLRGDVGIGVVGSGDVQLRGIGGRVRVGSHGSGDITVNDVGGALVVERSGSGDIRHRDVRGTVSLPRGK